MRLAKLISGLPHCTGPCDGSRERSTCTTGRVISVIRTRPSPMERLRRWLRAQALRMQLAGLSADAAASQNAIQRQQHRLDWECLTPVQASAAEAQVQLHKIGLLHLERQHDALLRELLDLGYAP